MINHILYVQPIFCPDQRRTDRNIASIKSMGEYLKQNGTDGIQISIVFGGYAKTDELWNQIHNAIKTYIGESVVPYRFQKNFGKAVIVNNLVKNADKMTTPYQAMLTADSDIIFPIENKHMFGRLAYAAIQLESYKKKPFGLLGLNQLQENCHYQTCQENYIEYMLDTAEGQMKEKIVWPTNPSGIAGGSLFLSKRLWDTVGGYKIFGVYGSDDALMLWDCGQHGFSWQMFDTLGIIHPPENDPEYSQWKVNTCQRDNRTGPKNNIDHLIKEADDFWDNHKS